MASSQVSASLQVSESLPPSQAVDAPTGAQIVEPQVTVGAMGQMTAREVREEFLSARKHGTGLVFRNAQIAGVLDLADFDFQASASFIGCDFVDGICT